MSDIQTIRVVLPDQNNFRVEVQLPTPLITSIQVLGQGRSGTSGYSGFSGPSGYSGYSSLSGYSGYCGLSGYSGYSGSGVSGYSGYSGFSGFSGYSGFSAYSGFCGLSGYSGFSSLSGYSGFCGLSGYSGFCGLSGFSGYSGSGISGYSGFSGLSGYSGYSGPSGYSGFSGLSGYSGFCGLSGYSGFSAASPGASGYSGFCGLSGYSGYCGLSGYSGYCGLSGYSGFSSKSGYSGFCGLSGYSGFSGVGGGGSGQNLTKDINQTGHGLSVGNVVRFDGANFVLAQSDTDVDAEVVGIVKTVIDSNNFTILISGWVDFLSSLTAGSVYYLDPSTPGTLTSTPPTSGGQVSKPLLIAISATTGFWFNWRGITNTIGTSTVFSNPGGRLTTESGVPVSTTDRTSQGTLYYTAYKHNNIYTYNGSVWQAKTFSEISLALTLTSGKNYDVFINSAATTLSLSSAWTNDTTRADALANQDGVTVLSSDHTKLWLGTIRASGSNVTEDSAGGTTSQTGGKRFVWNVYHQVTRPIKVIDTTDNWSYTTNTIRQANSASGNKVEYVTGDLTTPVDVILNANVGVAQNASFAAKAGIGIDSTTTFSGLMGECYDSGAFTLNVAISSRYNGVPGLGYHYISWNEKGADGTLCVFLGDNGGDDSQSGLIAVLPN